MGWVFPLPVVVRVERLADAVRAVGWEGARALLHDEFKGWEADLVLPALARLDAFDRADDMRTLGHEVAVALRGAQ